MSCLRELLYLYRSVNMLSYLVSGESFANSGSEDIIAKWYVLIIRVVYKLELNKPFHTSHYAADQSVSFGLDSLTVSSDFQMTSRSSSSKLMRMKLFGIFLAPNPNATCVSCSVAHTYVV